MVLPLPCLVVTFDRGEAREDSPLRSLDSVVPSGLDTALLRSEPLLEDMLLEVLLEDMLLEVLLEDMLPEVLLEDMLPEVLADLEEDSRAVVLPDTEVVTRGTVRSKQQRRR